MSSYARYTRIILVVFLYIIIFVFICIYVFLFYFKRTINEYNICFDEFEIVLPRDGVYKILEIKKHEHTYFIKMMLCYQAIKNDPVQTEEVKIFDKIYTENSISSVFSLC